jgi:hypothetical protein
MQWILVSGYLYNYLVQIWNAVKEMSYKLQLEWPGHITF